MKGRRRTREGKENHIFREKEGKKNYLGVRERGDGKEYVARDEEER